MKSAKNTIKRILSLKSVNNPVMSPDGTSIAYTVRLADWKKDRFVTETWLINVNSGNQQRLLTSDFNASHVQWSPDGNIIGFISRHEKNNVSGPRTKQVLTICKHGGEVKKVTHSDFDVFDFKWAPDGKQIAYSGLLLSDANSVDKSTLKADFEVVEEINWSVGLWVVDIGYKDTCPVISDAQRSVVDFQWSPTRNEIALTLATDPRPKGGQSRTIHVLNVNTLSTSVLTSRSGPNDGPIWSPSGDHIAFHTTEGDSNYSYANRVVAVVSRKGRNSTLLTDDFDESCELSAWSHSGIYFSAHQRTGSHLFLLNPQTKEIKRISEADNWIGHEFRFSADFKSVTFESEDGGRLKEVFFSKLTDFKPKQLTRINSHVRRWRTGTRELIQWYARDGLEIEGVLCKPCNFNPKNKHPLLVILHGGPNWIARPVLDLIYDFYPVEQWLKQGAVILFPNYRGSAGYGSRFRAMNVRSLGFGEMKDVLSGIEFLNDQGYIDEARTGLMGWSAGGSIAAFLATHTQHFKAISVGAGVTNWVNYYTNSDFTPFTLHYLQATPWEDPLIYKLTSPMRNITQATTPTLIQHGEKDQRVPISNAYELRQGLADQKVPVKMVIYKNTGHIPSTPAAIMTAVLHNLEWFDQWIFESEQ